MPQNKRESLIYSVMMCFTMVLWMSMYNVTLHMGGFSTEVLREGWLGFPIAVVFAFCMDWFVGGATWDRHDRDSFCFLDVVNICTAHAPEEISL